MTEQLRIVIAAEVNKFKQNVDDAKKKLKDLESLQSIYTSTFNENNTSYEGYLQRCKERKIPRSAIMSEEEYEAAESGDMHPESNIRDEEWYQSDRLKPLHRSTIEDEEKSTVTTQLFKISISP